MDTSQILFSTALRWFLTILSAFFIAKLLWRRRWLYYHSAVLPGPLSLPLIGSPSIVFAKQEELFNSYPRVWRFWLGSDFLIATSKTEHIEYLLHNCLQKDFVSFYMYMDEISSSIVSQPYDRWKVNRRSLNHAFSSKLMEVYYVVFKKYANQAVRDFGECCDKKINLMPLLWENTLTTIFETFGEVDPERLSQKSSDIIPVIVRHLELVVNRITNPLYYFKPLWERSRTFKELTVSKFRSFDLAQEMIGQHPSSQPSPSKEDLMTPNFINSLRKSDPTPGEMVREFSSMCIAGSETSAALINCVLLAMSMYPQFQKKLYEEVKTVDDAITMQQLESLDYLDRVVKETVRLFSPVPIIFRHVEKTVKIGSQVFPAGCSVIIPIFHIHRREEYWPDPLKFDPDRFLPEEVSKRPRYSYLPFSYGPRNCIGMKYGLVGVKLMVANIVKEFELERGDHESFADVEVAYYLLAKPKEYYQVTLRKRKLNKV